MDSLGPRNGQTSDTTRRPQSRVSSLFDRARRIWLTELPVRRLGLETAVAELKTGTARLVDLHRDAEAAVKVAEVEVMLSEFLPATSQLYVESAVTARAADVVLNSIVDAAFRTATGLPEGPQKTALQQRAAKVSEELAVLRRGDGLPQKATEAATRMAAAFNATLDHTVVVKDDVELADVA